ncbi:uncharacterized protein LOC112639123 [Camponotus floridanus]|uniref:uncharacterized protein LOC112639123 n=1 Tax=Camponotus floridanus TaxID=104421 RepID=UPI000DC67B48|nr:uncharacterized protein LOC112639123 [Camponotus floridanus]
MVYREQKLINNDILLSAVYLDPRYKVLLSNTQLERAKIHLKHLWAKIISLNRNDNSMNESNENFNGSSSNSSETASTHDEFENLLKLKERQQNLTKTYSSRESDLYRIETELERYNIEQKRLNRKINVLQFWNEKKQNQSELYKLATTVLAVSATQVSVERLFSGLKFILSPLRTNIGENILENQLLVRANRIFCHEKETKSHIKEKRPLSLNTNECVVPKMLKKCQF